MHESEPVLDTKYEIPYEQRRLAILQKLIPKGDGDKALDLGCGSGVISEMLRNHSWSVTAVDLHPGNVARAKEKGFLAIEGDVISAVRSFADAQFGLVCATELIEHLDVEYRGELLSGAIKAVRPRRIPAALDPQQNVASWAGRLLLPRTHAGRPVQSMGRYA
jgi:2-polyprenyl-3-methyl-5-hydroxy-6-metoxy-1,4-benzoquinol methylase